MFHKGFKVELEVDNVDFVECMRVVNTRNSNYWMGNSPGSVFLRSVNYKKGLLGLEVVPYLKAAGVLCPDGLVKEILKKNGTSFYPYEKFPEFTCD